MTDIESQVSTNDTIVCKKMIYIIGVAISIVVLAIGMYAFVMLKNPLKIKV